MKTTQLYKKLDSLPDDLKKEVSDYVDYLLFKSGKTSKQNKAKFGSAKGFYHMRDDFDGPLSVFEEYMG